MNKEKYELSGRTMMEMLGTLAIVGVLSIGGIAGYSYAMDKYRANTTINEINMRAVDLVLQSSRGIELNLNEWSDTSMAGYTFSDPVKENDSIYLQISGLPERVCEMVADTLGSQFDLAVNGQHYSENNSTLCGDDNTIRVYFEETGAGVTCEPACGAGEICINGICVDDETQPTTPLCSSDEDCPECFTCYNGKCSTTSSGTCGPNGSGTCYNGNCQYDTCNSDSDCAAGEICGDANTSCTSETKPGKCLAINIATKKVILNGQEETFYLSRGPVSWWDARSLCNRLGKTMMSVNELVTDWGGSRYGDDHTLTPLGEALKSDLGGHVWTSDIYPTDTCYASYVSLFYGRVDNNSRHDAWGGFALCH